MSAVVPPRPGPLPGCVGLPLVAWVVTFELNAWAFARLEWAEGIAWIFLPAAVRVLSVLVCGWPAAVGLFLGALLTAGEVYPLGTVPAVVGPALSALAPLVAVTLWRRFVGLPADLHGLRAHDLLGLSVFAAACSVVPHNVYFWLEGVLDDPFRGLLPMFVGDLAGTFIVLYVLRTVLRLLERSRVRSSP